MGEYWALVSKLVLPITDGVTLGSITVVQWAAGAVAVACALAGVIFELAGVVPRRLDRGGAGALYALGSSDRAGALRLHGGDTVLDRPVLVRAHRARRWSCSLLTAWASRAGLALAGYALATGAIIAALALSAIET